MRTGRLFVGLPSARTSVAVRSGVCCGFALTGLAISFFGRIVLTMRKKFSVHKSGNTGNFGSGKSGTIQNFNY